MANKVTLDFETGMITWDTKYQQGTEFCPDLAAREDAILAAMGYSQIDLPPTVSAVNDYANGLITEEEFLKRLADQQED